MARRKGHVGVHHVNRNDTIRFVEVSRNRVSVMVNGSITRTRFEK